MITHRLLLSLACTALLAACTTGPGYYLQAVGGHLAVLGHTRPIDDILTDPGADPALKKRLEYVRRARDFAVRDLDLPDNGSYRDYAALDRPYVTWNVYATPALSLQSREWCFPLAGCVAYRGYFSARRARDYARRLADEGDDVYVAPASAYSTLGWLRDPLPSPVLRASDTEVAGIVIHELAHQKLYLPGDSAFNESFAMTVELEGVRRWLASGDVSDGDEAHRASELTRYLEGKQRRDDFLALLLRFRTRLEEVYRGPASDTEKREEKKRVFTDLQQAYGVLRATWHGYHGYDAWFEQPLNNAQLASVGIYDRYVASFQALLATHQGDLPRFYAEAAGLARLSPAQRETRLAQLRAGAATQR
jgi:predicted aminopeptidase